MFIIDSFLLLKSGRRKGGVRLVLIEREGNKDICLIYEGEEYEMTVSVIAREK
jgi:hypothetical protein